MAGQTRVVIAEDSAILRDGLVQLLVDRGFVVTDAVSGPDDLRESVDRECPDVAIVDIRMPPTFTDEGLRAALDLRRRHKGIGVLMFSQYIETRYAAEFAGRRCGRDRLPAEGPRRRRGRLRRGPHPSGVWKAPHLTQKWSPSSWGPPGAVTRSRC